MVAGDRESYLYDFGQLNVRREKRRDVSTKGGYTRSRIGILSQPELGDIEFQSEVIL